GEGHAPVDAQRFEDAVTGEQPMVEWRDPRVGFVDEGAVDPHHRHDEATSSSRRALSSVSSHSPCGVESQVMPPPVPKWMRPSANQKLRMPTLSSPRRRSASTHPMAPQYGPRDAG